MRRLHNSDVDTRHPCPVGMCKRVFQDMANMDSHVKLEHHDVSNVPCTVSGCKETFGSREFRDMHIASRHEKPFQCKHCKLAYKSEASLQNHIRDRCNVLHKSGKKELKCQHCHKVLTSKENLKKHLKKTCKVLYKNDVKCFQCEHCEARFIRMASLKKTYRQQLQGDSEALAIIFFALVLAKTFNTYAPLFRPNGIFINVGLPEWNFSEIRPILLAMIQVTICGSAIGSPAEIEDILEFAAKTGVRLWLPKTCPMSEAPKAVEDFKAGKPKFRFVLKN